MNFMLIAILILIKRECVLCFNIQTKLPVMVRPLIDEVDQEHPINFGVNLATLNKKENSTVLLAGAPAADLGDYHDRPGSIFNCDLNEQPNDEYENFSDSKNVSNAYVNCKPIRFFNLVRGLNKPIVHNNYMQIGSSISSSNTDDFTFCASATLNLNCKDHYPNGQCWFGNLRSSVAGQLSKKEIYLSNLINLNPLNNTKKQIGGNPVTYYYSHGMFGFSSKMSSVCVV